MELVVYLLPIKIQLKFLVYQHNNFLICLLIYHKIGVVVTQKNYVMVTC